MQKKENASASKYQLHHRTMVEDIRANSQDELESKKIDLKDYEEAQAQAHAQAQSQNHVARTITSRGQIAITGIRSYFKCRSTTQYTRRDENQIDHRVIIRCL